MTAGLDLKDTQVAARKVDMGAQQIGRLERQLARQLSIARSAKAIPNRIWGPLLLLLIVGGPLAFIWLLGFYWLSKKPASPIELIIMWTLVMGSLSLVVLRLTEAMMKASAARTTEQLARARSHHARTVSSYEAAIARQRSVEAWRHSVEAWQHSVERVHHELDVLFAGARAERR